MVNAQDFTYSKGYLGLLSALGASLGITFCCAPAAPGVYHQWRTTLLERASRLTHVNERSTAVASGIPNAISFPKSKNDAAHTHRGSAIWRIFEYRYFKAYLKWAPRAVITDGEETAVAFEIPYENSWLASCSNLSFRTHQLEITSNAYQGTVELEKNGVAPDIENPSGLSLPTTEDKTTQTRDRST